MAQENFGTFLASWSGELAAQAQRVRNLIGDSHWLSDGNHKEAILRSFLRRYLPTSLTVATGFAINPEHPNRITKQQDILICDLRAQAPFLVEEGFFIVPSASVAATLEVKSTLSSAVLRKALESIAYSGSVLSGQECAPWRGVVFFSSEASSHEQFSDWVIAALGKISPECLRSEDGPICFISVGRFVAFLEIAQRRLRVVPTKEKSLAFGILDIIRTARERLGEGQQSQFDVLAGATFEETPSIFEVKLLGAR